MSTRTYKGYTLEEAKSDLELWKSAKRAAATGKYYQIGGRQLTRYDLADINKEIAFFTEVIDALAGGTTSPTYVTVRMKR
ncbi:hypothetical protein C4J81_16340 [Deltaproteobacteria bacterium Smac51]|nr:hypothetical protein C4J81_16340 [Deltaproteobacteria bacterium Smac51]